MFNPGDRVRVISYGGSKERHDDSVVGMIGRVVGKREHYFIVLIGNEEWYCLESELELLDVTKLLQEWNEAEEAASSAKEAFLAAITS